MLYVRWMGAFRKVAPLHEALKYELNRPVTDEVAVEPINADGQQVNAKVGLLVDKKAVVKTFRGDCWSERRPDGRLCKTRNPRLAPGRHMEAWANPRYTGIIVSAGVYRDRGEGFYNLPARIRGTIKWYSNLYGLPVYHLVGGKLEVVVF